MENQSSRWRLQLSIRTLLELTAVVAVILAFWFARTRWGVNRSGYFLSVPAAASTSNKRVISGRCDRGSFGGSNVGSEPAVAGRAKTGRRDLGSCEVASRVSPITASAADTGLGPRFASGPLFDRRFAASPKSLHASSWSHLSPLACTYECLPTACEPDQRDTPASIRSRAWLLPHL